jgi:hypothetical protein
LESDLLLRKRVEDEDEGVVVVAVVVAPFPPPFPPFPRGCCCWYSRVMCVAVRARVFPEKKKKWCVWVCDVLRGEKR